jgi:probable rRNA maturation factor
MTKKATAVNVLALGPGLKKIIVGVLASEGIRKGFVSVVPASDKVLRKLNRIFHKRNRPTDVLAFDYSAVTDLKFIAGDVFVSVDVARRVSKQLGISFKEELVRYCIHGVLHLIGYDDTTAAKKKKMWQRQESHVKNIFSHKVHRSQSHTKQPCDLVSL